MGWEERSGLLYYYRKVRDGHTVRSEYVGSHPVASTIAEYEQAHRLVEASKRAQDRHERQALREEAQRVDELVSYVTALTHAALLTSGFHTHKGQWRKRRE